MAGECWAPGRMVPLPHPPRPPLPRMALLGPPLGACRLPWMMAGASLLARPPAASQVSAGLEVQRGLPGVGTGVLWCSSPRARTQLLSIRSARFLLLPHGFGGLPSMELPVGDPKAHNFLLPTRWGGDTDGQATPVGTFREGAPPPNPQIGLPPFPGAGARRWDLTWVSLSLGRAERDGPALQSVRRCCLRVPLWGPCL